MLSAVADLALLVGPVGAIGLVPLALGAVAVQRRTWPSLFRTAGLAAVVVATWLVYWKMWGTEFNYLDAGRAVPALIDLAGNGALVCCAGMVILLAATTIRVVARSLRLSTTANGS